RVSFIAQSDQRIDSSCPSRWNVASEKRYRSKCSGDGAESNGIGGTDPEQHGAHESCEHHRSHQSCCEPDDNKSHSFPHRHTENVYALRAQGDANSDFVHTLAKRIRHHAVDPDGGEQKSDRRKNAEKLKGEAPVSHRSHDNLIHGADAMDRNIGIDFFNFAPHGLAEISNVGPTSQKNHRVDWRELTQRNINMRHAGSVKTVRFDIAHHANNRDALNACTKSKFDLLSERILVRPITSCESLVDDSNSLRVIGIEEGEIPTGDQRNFHGTEILRIHDGDVCNRVALGIFR